MVDSYVIPPQMRRDVSTDLLRSCKNDMSDTDFRRALHVTGENERVALGVDCLERGDVAAFGKLLFQSHESSRTLFENSCPELDALVEIAHSLPGCAGARLSGGGFGGISIHLVQSDMTGDYGRRLAEAYRLQTGKEIDVLVCSIGDGARLAD